VRLIANTILFSFEGGLFDQSFAITNLDVRQFATEFYPFASAFQPNFFHANLTTRGLLNCTYGPALKSFPFLSDAFVIHSSITAFLTTFVTTYYPTPRLLALDHELQNWISEASLHAGVIDFPPAPLTSRTTLISILRHLAFLNSVAHNTLNGAELFQVSGTLPLHPAELYAPPPTAKGPSDVDILSYLPLLKETVENIALVAFFSPTFTDPKQTLAKMFDEGEELFEKGEGRVRSAARRFGEQMGAFSEVLRGRAERGFDGGGLAGGMPFVWRALDPGRVPFFLMFRVTTYLLTVGRRGGAGQSG